MQVKALAAKKMQILHHVLDPKMDERSKLFVAAQKFLMFVLHEPTIAWILDRGHKLHSIFHRSSFPNPEEPEFRWVVA